VGYVDDTTQSEIDFETGEVIQTGEKKIKEGIKKYSTKVQEGIEDLFLEYIRIAKGIQPKVIVAENVKGITFGESKKKLLEFINDFERIGYEVSYQVLNAADFGTPQARERTIFICVRKDVASKIGLNFMNINGIFPSKTVSKHVSMKEAFEDIENDPEEVKMLLDYVEGSFQKKFLSFLPFNPEKPLKPSDKQFHDNLKELISNKKDDQEIFDGITSRHVNAYYSTLVKGLTAKVFRTYLASSVVSKYLRDHDNIKSESNMKKLFHAKMAYLDSAIMCNHKRTIPKNFEQSLQKKKDTLSNVEKSKPWLLHKSRFLVRH